MPQKSNTNTEKKQKRFQRIHAIAHLIKQTSSRFSNHFIILQPPPPLLAAGVMITESLALVVDSSISGRGVSFRAEDALKTLQTL